MQVSPVVQRRPGYRKPCSAPRRRAHIVSWMEPHRPVVGRNSTGGALIVASAKPGGELGMKLKASVGNGALRISLWARNLTDKEYREWGIDFATLGFAGATWGRPRSYGIDLVYRVGG